MSGAARGREIAIGAALCLLLVQCGSSSAGPAPDAGRPDAAPIDAGHESGSGFPLDDSGGGPPDAGSECDQLRAQVTALQITARACNPQGASECTAAIDGICCPITVSISNNGPVNDFTQAVLAYKAKCKPDCSTVICGAAPTNVCTGTGNQGLCETTN
jgi:hypothetical protein